MSLLHSLQASPIDYYGPHKDTLHSFGGYAPNFTTPLTTKSPQAVSTTRRDYLPPILPNPQETCSSSSHIFLGRSGFSANKALHNPSYVDVLRSRLEQASDFYNLKSRLAGDCTIPNSLITESNERFNNNSLYYDDCGATNHNWMHCPGSRDSGFTNCYSSVNPVYWRQHDPLMDQLGKNPPEIRMNAASVSQTDYQPYDLVSYETSPITGCIRTRGLATGFRTETQLDKCFLPKPCVYGYNTPSYISPNFETSYNHDYKHRQKICTSTGMELIGKGKYVPKALSNDSSADFSLGCGPPRDFITETREKFIDFRPTEAEKTLGLANPVSTVSSSGFVHSIKKHARESGKCGELPDVYDTTPTRYDPWPRFYLGHNTLVDKNYRPNPIRTGIDYTITTSLPTTGDHPDVFLY